MDFAYDASVYSEKIAKDCGQMQQTVSQGTASQDMFIIGSMNCFTVQSLAANPCAAIMKSSI